MRDIVAELLQNFGFNKLFNGPVLAPLPEIGKILVVVVTWDIQGGPVEPGYVLGALRALFEKYVTVPEVVVALKVVPDVLRSTFIESTRSVAKLERYGRYGNYNMRDL